MKKDSIVEVEKVDGSSSIEVNEKKGKKEKEKYLPMMRKARWKMLINYLRAFAAEGMSTRGLMNVL